jgi:uncharacterized protein (TIGR01244 family)
MTYRMLSPRFCVAGQLDAEAIRALAGEGFTTVICNRPDGEEPGQPPRARLEAAAHEAGLDFHFIPVSGGQFPADSVEAFAAALAGAKGKALAFCRSGMRSTCLWALASAGTAEPAGIIAAAAEAGYDISGLAPALHARHGD